ncbi:DUF3575 domain-containing protein [Sphingobacteriales bacterium UPWRP_1]|nr:hypothetical protein B6N25_03875 [Sphingobacteriales bacterium TSM_CSS]PSJ76663.1 DUF3575 domain-containing protein [Sphingobacteriales bacterium UPWRP_1]
MKTRLFLAALLLFLLMQPLWAQGNERYGHYCVAAGGNQLIGLSEIDVSLAPALHVEGSFTKNISAYGTAAYIGDLSFVNGGSGSQLSGVVAGFGFRYYFIDWLLKKPLEGYYIGVQPLVQSYQRTNTYNYYPQGSYEDNTRVLAGGVAAMAGGRWISKRSISLDIWIGAGVLGGRVTNKYGAYPPATTVTEIKENRTMGLFNSGIAVGYIF